MQASSGGYKRKTHQLKEKCKRYLVQQLISKFMKVLNTSEFIVTNPVHLHEIPTVLETVKAKKETKKDLKIVGKRLGKHV